MFFLFHLFTITYQKKYIYKKNHVNMVLLIKLGRQLVLIRKVAGFGLVPPLLKSSNINVLKV